MLDYKLLITSPLFTGLSENELIVLLTHVHYQIKIFNKNEIVALAGEQALNLFIVLSGSVKGEMIDYSGKIIKIEDVEAPRPLAAAFLFGTNNKFPVTVTANDDVRMLIIPVKGFLSLMQKNSTILKNYLDNITSRSQFLSEKIKFLSFKTIKGKLAYYFMQLSSQNLHSIQLKATQQQLADLFGVTRPSLARVLGEMQQKKLILVERKTVTILNREKLKSILLNG